jgi:hypothetical protein
MPDEDPRLLKRKWLRITLWILVAIGALLILLQAAVTVLVALNLGKG